jgi:hypothetical protein
MSRKVFMMFSIMCCFVCVSYAQVLVQDGFEGPWDFPESTYADGTGGGGIDEDWFASHVNWVGDKQFQLDQDEVNKTEGDYSQTANSSVNDSNIRDLYLARLITGVESGVQYKISLDYRFDQGDKDNHIQYTMRDGDNRTQDDIADIEQYGGHERPDTMKVDPATFDTGEFHTLEVNYTPSYDQTSFTFMMIVRFWSSELEDNWLWLDNFIVEVDQPTAVCDWSVFE